MSHQIVGMKPTKAGEYRIEISTPKAMLFSDPDPMVSGIDVHGSVAEYVDAVKVNLRGQFATAVEIVVNVYNVQEPTIFIALDVPASVPKGMTVERFWGGQIAEVERKVREAGDWLHTDSRVEPGLEISRVALLGKIAPTQDSGHNPMARTGWLDEAFVAMINDAEGTDRLASHLEYAINQFEAALAVVKAHSNEVMFAGTKIDERMIEQYREQRKPRR